MNDDEQRRLLAAKPDLMQRGDLYHQRAGARDLYRFQACQHGHGEQLIVQNVTKGELTSLYSDCMSVDKSSGRPYYDHLMLAAPLGMCPYCCFGQATTLDHFLSKSRYPEFAVLPSNLVPSCKDCNEGKGAQVVVQGAQIPHPYFEDEEIENDVWLWADVVQNIPATIRFRCAPPVHWPQDRTRRVLNYFQDFDLAKRFGVQAGPELAMLAVRLQGIQSPACRGLHLLESAGAEYAVRRNSWKTAMYRALAVDAWYVQGGYIRP